MKIAKLLALVLALSLSCAANAVVLLGSTGANTVTDYSTPGAVSFDLDLADFGTTTLDFMLEAGDLQGPLSFDALVRNLAGAELSRFTFTLQGISFAGAGSVTPSFGTLGSATNGATSAAVSFATPEFSEFQFGDVLGTAGTSDWLLATSGLNAGERFSITATVPEPSTAALLLPMLCMAGLMAARRRKDQ